MTLNEAFDSAVAGNFITHESFSSTKSIHHINKTFYYEDGTILSRRVRLQLSEKDWAKEGWLIKYPVSIVDREKLNDMHKDPQGISYEEAVNKEKCM